MWCINEPDGDFTVEYPDGGYYWADAAKSGLRVSELIVAGHSFKGFDEYGFQRIAVTPQGGKPQETGFQVFCKTESWVIVWTLEAGKCKTEMVPSSSITYNPELWIKGVRDGQQGSNKN